jgi:hypothetical protein
VTYVPGTVPQDSDVSFGNVFERSFSIVMRNFAPLLLLGAIAALPYLAIYALQGDDVAVAPTATPKFSPQVLIIGGLSMIAAFALRPICEAIILFGAFQDMLGRAFPLGESLRKGVARMFPIFGMLIVGGVGVLIGLMLLIIPGYMLLIAWYVALPVVVVERLGPVASLRRSAQLTKGHRWKIFGIILVMAIVSGIIGGVINVVALMFHNNVVHSVVEYLFQAVLVAFESVVGVVLYHDLRAAKEGVNTERIAAVFD